MIAADSPRMIALVVVVIGPFLPGTVILNVIFRRSVIPVPSTDSTPIRQRRSVQGTQLAAIVLPHDGGRQGLGRTACWHASRTSTTCDQFGPSKARRWAITSATGTTSAYFTAMS